MPQIRCRVLLSRFLLSVFLSNDFKFQIFFLFFLLTAPRPLHALHAVLVPVLVRMPSVILAGRDVGASEYAPTILALRWDRNADHLPPELGKMLLTSELVPGGACLSLRIVSRLHPGADHAQRLFLWFRGSVGRSDVFRLRTLVDLWNARVYEPLSGTTARSRTIILTHLQPTTSAVAVRTAEHGLVRVHA